MIKDLKSRREFRARNHTVLTGFRHKQKQATLIVQNKRDRQSLLSINTIIYISENKAALNYRYGHPNVPFLEKNFIKFYAKAKKDYL